MREIDLDKSICLGAVLRGTRVMDRRHSTLCVRPAEADTNTHMTISTLYWHVVTFWIKLGPWLVLKDATNAHSCLQSYNNACYHTSHYHYWILNLTQCYSQKAIGVRSICMRSAVEGNSWLHVIAQPISDNMPANWNVHRTKNNLRRLW